MLCYMSRTISGFIIDNNEAICVATDKYEKKKEQRERKGGRREDGRQR